MDLFLFSFFNFWSFSRKTYNSVTKSFFQSPTSVLASKSFMCLSVNSLSFIIRLFFWSSTPKNFRSLKYYRTFSYFSSTFRIPSNLLFFGIDELFVMVSSALNFYPLTPSFWSVLFFCSELETKIRIAHSCGDCLLASILNGLPWIVFPWICSCVFLMESFCMFGFEDGE